MPSKIVLDVLAAPDLLAYMNGGRSYLTKMNFILSHFCTGSFNQKHLFIRQSWSLMRFVWLPLKIIIYMKKNVLHHIDQFLEILKMHFTHQIFINTIAGGVLETTVSNSFKHLCNLCVSTSFSTIFLEANAHLKCALRITYPIKKNKGFGPASLGRSKLHQKHMVIQWKLQNKYIPEN